MTESILFTLAAVGLYMLADWLLERIEVAAGRRFDNRSLIFFAILTVLAVSSFALIRRYTG